MLELDNFIQVGAVNVLSQIEERGEVPKFLVLTLSGALSVKSKTNTVTGSPVA